MASEHIVAWLRIRDIQRFVRDAHRAERAIKGIKDAADDGPLNQMGGALQELTNSLPNLTGRTRIFGFALGTVVTAGIASIPVIVSLGGSVVALAGSLGAATLGAGLLGVAVAGAAVPLGFLGLVALNAASGFKKVQTAWDTYNRTVASFGKNSTQAETALARLQGYVKWYGGPIMLRAVRNWTNLQNQFQEANKPAMRIALGTFIEFTNTVRKILPWFSRVTAQVAGSLHDALQPVFSEIGGSEFRHLIQSLTDLFSVIAGPLVSSAMNFLMGLLNIASRLAGNVGPMAGGLERISIAFRNWATTGDLKPLLSQFWQWWGLLKSIGRLLYNILAGGAQAGQGLVASLTAIVDKWNQWLESNPDKLGSFFADAVRSTKIFIGFIAGIIGFLFKFGRATMGPVSKGVAVLKKAWGQLMDALAPAEPFFKNILWPLLGGIAKGVIGSLVGAWKTLIFTIKIVATVLGWLGDKLSFLKGPLNVVGQILGFIFSGAILKVLGSLGKLNILLGPLGTAFRILAVPLRATGAVVGWFLGKFAALGGWIITHAARLFSPFRGAISSILDFLAGTGSKFFNMGVKIWNFLKKGIFKAIGAGLGFAGDMAKAVANAVIKLLNSAIPNRIPIPGAPDIDLPDNPIPMLAAGGVVSGSGSWITGEAGPEINTLRNGRVTVVPLTPSVQVSTPSATLMPNEGRVLVSKVYLRGRQIAEAVAEEADDERARVGARR